MTYFIQEVYTDHLLLSDFDKWERLAQKHFGDSGQDFNKRPPNKIEAFLKDWYDRDLELVEISETKNVATGFPTWKMEISFNENTPEK